jgi:O-acetyl-ADP-ribose deacetylase (regulator of RNase III)
MALPILCIGDRKSAAVEHAERYGLGDEWYAGWDPLAIPALDGIVSPANTIGEMSGGYDLTLRTAYQRQKIAIQPIVQKSIREKKIHLGEARALHVGGTIPWLIVVPTVIGKNDEHGLMQSATPSADIISKGTYSLMKAAMDAGLARIGTVLLGAGVGGMTYTKSVNAMADGYFQFLDDHQ